LLLESSGDVVVEVAAAVCKTMKLLVDRRWHERSCVRRRHVIVGPLCAAQHTRHSALHYRTYSQGVLSRIEVTFTEHFYPYEDEGMNVSQHSGKWKTDEAGRRKRRIRFFISFNGVITLEEEYRLMMERTGRWGEYLDRVDMKWQDVGENCIMRSFIACTLAKYY
jgi:hypothetical protein